MTATSAAPATLTDRHEEIETWLYILKPVVEHAERQASNVLFSAEDARRTLDGLTFLANENRNVRFSLSEIGGDRERLDYAERTLRPVVLPLLQRIYGAAAIPDTCTLREALDLASAADAERAA